MALHFAIAKSKVQLQSPSRSSLINSVGRSVCKLTSRDVSELRYRGYDLHRLNKICSRLNMRQGLRGRTGAIKDSGHNAFFLSSFHRNKRNRPAPVRLGLIPLFGAV
jgi:hypothetical protein